MPAEFPLDFLINYLEEKVMQYNRPEFIETDPVFVPHQYSEKEDIEIAGFLAAVIAWGNRTMILKNALRMMAELGPSPYDFVMEAKDAQIRKLKSGHRTFKPEDFQNFIYGLRHIYRNCGGMSSIFAAHAEEPFLHDAIADFRRLFFSVPMPPRTHKHIPNTASGSAAKRLHMMLRWYVRKDRQGVDLGIWNGLLKPSQLSIPLDLHSGNTARALGLLTRKQNDLKAVMELDAVLREMDSKDPAKYDFALFGIGIFEKNLND